MPQCRLTHHAGFHQFPQAVHGKCEVPVRLDSRVVKGVAGLANLQRLNGTRGGNFPKGRVAAKASVLSQLNIYI